MTKTLAQTYTLAHEYRRSITTTLMVACMVCALFYAVNIYRTVSHSMSIRQMNMDIASVDADIQRLDSQYASLSSTITPDTLRTYGFDNADVSAFISRTTSLGMARGAYGF